METVANMTLDDVLEIITDFPVQPLGRRVIVTLNMEEIDGNMILTDNSLSETQYVLAVGSHIDDIKPGMKVLLDLENMMEYIPNPENAYEKLGRVKVRPIKIGEKIFALINDRVIDAIDNR